MGTVLGDLLPLAVGVAISPIPIIAVILMLLSRQAGRTSAGFALGWVTGIVVVTVAVLLLVDQAAGDESGPSVFASVLKLVFGVLLLLVAAKQWRQRPKDGEVATMPKWMGAIDSFTFGKAFGLGALLSGVNPKNLLMCLAAGTTIGAGGLSGGGVAVSVVLFTVLASTTVSGPVVGYLLMRDRIVARLPALRAWLERNNAVVMAVLLLVMGTVLLGKGIAGFSG